MRKIVWFLLMMFLSMILSAQDLIPRRILFRGFSELPSNLLLLDDMLYSSLNQQETLIRTEDPETAHNTLVLENQEERFILVLMEEGQELDSQEIGSRLSDEALQALCQVLADRWKDFLGPVPPRVETVQEVKVQEMKESVLFESAMAKSYQFSLHLTPLSFQIGGDGGSMRTKAFIEGTPVNAESTWFYRENLGLTLSLFYQYTQNIAGYVDDNRDPLPGDVHISLMGGGFSYRSLGEISAQVDILFYAGPAHSTAFVDDIPTGVTQGDSYDTLIFALGFHSGILWNPSPDYGISLRYLFHFNPMISSGEGEDKPDIIEATALNMGLQLGISYRRD